MRSSQHHYRVPSFIPSADFLSGSGNHRSRTSSKYDNIKASIDSGLNMHKLSEKFPESKVNARFKREEFFRRINPSTLVRLQNEGYVDCLILDVRDCEAFQSCHLKHALSFPALLLRRSVNVFSLEILSFINKEPKKIIVIYDENGLSALSTGNLFAEKGVNNIFMLTGGLREMALKHPDMLEGSSISQCSAYPETPTPSVKSELYSRASFSLKSSWHPASVALMGKN